MVALRRNDSIVAGSAGGLGVVTEFGQTNNDTVGLAATRSAVDAFEAVGHSWTIWSPQLMNFLQAWRRRGKRPPGRADPEKFSTRCSGTNAPLDDDAS